MIKIFATPAGGLKCILKEHLPLQEILQNQQHPANVLNSDFYLCPLSKQHLQNCLIDSKDFLTQTTKGIRHILNQKCNQKYGGHIFKYGR